MLNKTVYILLALLFYVSTNPAQSAEELFKLGNTAYANEQYDSAFSIYSKIEHKDLYSVELYKNMGSAAYHLNDIPNAIYYFEKGLKLAPNDKDLLHNAELANKKVVDKGGTYKRTGFSSWLGNLIGNTPDHWAIRAIWFCVTGAILLFIYLFIKINVLKKTGLYMGILSWIVALIMVVFAYVQNRNLQNEEFAIIYTPSIDIKNEPSEVSSTVFVLHEGSKVKILDATADWFKISFGEDKIGWINRTELKVI